MGSHDGIIGREREIQSCTLAFSHYDLPQVMRQQEVPHQTPSSAQGISSLQNHEINKTHLFVNYPISGILLQQQRTDQGISPSC
jgi:hypothetical protein